MVDEKKIDGTTDSLPGAFSASSWGGILDVTLADDTSTGAGMVFSASATGTLDVSIGDDMLSGVGLIPVQQAGSSPPLVLAEQVTVSTRSQSWGAIVKRAWGSEYNRPDVSYEFSNGRKFLSTDRDESGVYRRN